MSERDAKYPWGLSADEELQATVKREAEAAGVSASRLVRDVLRAELDRRTATEKKTPRQR